MLCLQHSAMHLRMRARSSWDAEALRKAASLHWRSYDEKTLPLLFCQRLQIYHYRRSPTVTLPSSGRTSFVAFEFYYLLRVPTNAHFRSGAPPWPQLGYSQQGPPPPQPTGHPHRDAVGVAPPPPMYNTQNQHGLEPPPGGVTGYDAELHSRMTGMSINGSFSKLWVSLSWMASLSDAGGSVMTLFPS